MCAYSGFGGNQGNESFLSIAVATKGVKKMQVLAAIAGLVGTKVLKVFFKYGRERRLDTRKPKKILSISGKGSSWEWLQKWSRKKKY